MFCKFHEAGPQLEDVHGWVEVRDRLAMRDLVVLIVPPHAKTSSRLEDPSRQEKAAANFQTCRFGADACMPNLPVPLQSGLIQLWYQGIYVILHAPCGR